MEGNEQNETVAGGRYRTADGQEVNAMGEALGKAKAAKPSADEQMQAHLRGQLGAAADAPADAMAAQPHPGHAGYMSRAEAEVIEGADASQVAGAPLEGARAESGATTGAEALEQDDEGEPQSGRAAAKSAAAKQARRK